MATMNALVYTKPGQIVMREVEKPTPGPGQLLVEVAAVGICGSELDGFLGKSRKRKPPLVMGHEFAGEIAGVGQPVPSRADEFGITSGRVVVNPLVTCGECPPCLAGRSNICPNRRLIGMDGGPGAFAQYVVVPTEHAIALPESISFAAGTFVDPLATVVHAIGKVKHGGGSALVIGAGTIGLLSIRVLTLLGHRYIAAAEPNARRRELAISFGASDVLDPLDTRGAAELRKIAEDEIELVVDAVGTGKSRADAVELVTPGGRILCIGQKDGENYSDSRDMVTKELTLQGSYAYTNDDFAGAIRLLADRQVEPQPLITEMPLSEGPGAFAELTANPGTNLTKVVLTP